MSEILNQNNITEKSLVLYSYLFLTNCASGLTSWVQGWLQENSCITPPWAYIMFWNFYFLPGFLLKTCQFCRNVSTRAVLGLRLLRYFPIANYPSFLIFIVTLINLQTPWLPWHMIIELIFKYPYEICTKSVRDLYKIHTKSVQNPYEMDLQAAWPGFSKLWNICFLT